MQKITRRKLIKRGLLATIGMFLIDVLWFEKYVIDWNFFDISKKKDKLKIIQLSDLHFDELRSFHKSIAKKINKIKPDVILITGDSVEKTDKILLLNSFLQLIDITIPKYAVMGNWEYKGRVAVDKLSSMYSKNNCKLLINQNDTINLKNREVAIVGVGDYISGTADFEKAVKDLKKGETTIVLSHCPQHRDIIKKQQGSLEIDLVLSGHTHGGQVTFLGIAPVRPRGSGRYVKGWYKESEPKMYVSKGIGTSILPIRFGARAEVVEIDV